MALCCKSETQYEKVRDYGFTAEWLETLVL